MMANITFEHNFKQDFHILLAADTLLNTAQVAVADGWWLMLICYKRKLLLTG